MARYLIDVNLPCYFSLWNDPSYVYVKDLDDEWTDSEIWHYARRNDLTIVTKDADFSDRVLLSEPPPRVIQIRLGNLKMRDFHRAISSVWSAVCQLSEHHRLIQVLEDRIEAID